MIKLFLSIEPILDFDLDIFVQMLKEINPSYISIGADSKNHNLPEPSKEKIKELIDSCRCFTEVKIKDNLVRLYDYPTPLKTDSEDSIPTP